MAAARINTVMKGVTDCDSFSVTNFAKEVIAKLVDDISPHEPDL